MPARMEAEARKQIATKAMERQLRTRPSQGDGPDEATSRRDRGGQTAASIEVPPVPRLVADDVTPEAAASLLAEQRGRLAIISAEGGIFDIIAGRYNGNVPNMDLWLKGHSGDMIRVDRKGRPPEYIPRPALTLGLMIQPEVLGAIAAQRSFPWTRTARPVPVRPAGVAGRASPDRTRSVARDGPVRLRRRISRARDGEWPAGSAIPPC